MKFNPTIANYNGIDNNIQHYNHIDTINRPLPQRRNFGHGGQKIRPWTNTITNINTKIRSNIENFTHKENGIDIGLRKSYANAAKKIQENDNLIPFLEQVLKVAKMK